MHTRVYPCVCACAHLVVSCGICLYTGTEGACGYEFKDDLFTPYHCAFNQSTPIHTFTHTHQQRLDAMQSTIQLIRSNWRLGVLFRDTSPRPGWDPPTARRLPDDCSYLLSHITPIRRYRTGRMNTNLQRNFVVMN